MTDSQGGNVCVSFLIWMEIILCAPAWFNLLLSKILGELSWENPDGRVSSHHQPHSATEDRVPGGLSHLPKARGSGDLSSQSLA